MAFPLTHLLIGCGVGEVFSASTGRSRGRAWALGGSLAMIPDMDLLLPIRHGTWTHSLLAVAAVTLVVGVPAGWRWGILACVAYGSHIVLDLLDGQGATNVYLGWPFSHRRAVAIADLFPDASLALRREDLRAILIQIVLGAIGLLLLWLLARVIGAQRLVEEV